MNVLKVTWDSEENLNKMETTLKLWTKGCTCKSGCLNNRCGCRKREGKTCGPGCSCKGKCSNAPLNPNLSNIIEEILGNEVEGTEVNFTDRSHKFPKGIELNPSYP